MPYQSLSTELTVGNSTTTATINGALAALQAMTLSGGEGAAQGIALRNLTDVANRAILGQRDREAMIIDLRTAATALLGITSQNTGVVRNGIDSLLLFWQAEWYFNRTP
jgi:hypothetical protein